MEGDKPAFNASPYIINRIGASDEKVPVRVGDLLAGLIPVWPLVGIAIDLDMAGKK